MSVLTTSVLANSRSRSSSGRPIVRNDRFKIATRVAEALGLVEPVRGEEDRHTAAARARRSARGRLGGHRIEAGGRLVKEQHLRLAQQRSRQGDPLTQTLGQSAAGIVRPVGQVDGPQDAVDAIAAGRATS